MKALLMLQITGSVNSHVFIFINVFFLHIIIFEKLRGLTQKHVKIDKLVKK